MALSSYNTTEPLDISFEGDGASHIRLMAVKIKERLELDHNMDGVLDTSLPTADGYHKKITMKKQSSDPSILTGGAVEYCKDSTKTVTANTTSGSAVITVDKSYHLKVGDSITGTGIPASATIISIDAYDQITISENATATNTGITLTCATESLYFRNSKGIVRII